MNLNLMNSGLDSMIHTAKHLYCRLERDGHLTLYSPELSNIVRTIANVGSSKCFMIIEGIAEHFVINLDGAYKLKEELINSQESRAEKNDHKKAMSDVAIKQLDVIIDYMEANNEYN